MDVFEGIIGNFGLTTPKSVIFILIQQLGRVRLTSVLIAPNLKSSHAWGVLTQMEWALSKED